MSTHARGSRKQFEQYRKDFKAHKTEGTSRTGAGHAIHKKSQRSFVTLFKSFLRLVHKYRGTIAIALTLVSCATLLSLIPPYSIKLIADNVLGDTPLPAFLAETLKLPQDKGQLLKVVVLGFIGISVIAMTIGSTGRWLATRTTKRMQADVRRKVFERAVRLPMGRIQKLKSGGVASILREDAGSVAELIFGMLYNPTKAIIQLIGSLIVLAFMNWQLLLGSLILIPSVFITHRAWISRIRPLFRDIRATRQRIDSHATEAFGGMRVVRAFGRQRSETSRFTRNNHLLARMEILSWWWSRTVDITWSLLIPGASAGLLWFGGAQILNDAAQVAAGVGLTNAERIAAGLILPEDAMTIGSLMAFLAYVAWLLGPLATLASSATQVQNSLAGLDRVLDLMDEDSELGNAKGGTVLEQAKVAGAISIRNMSFTYPGHDQEVLHDINLEVQAGSMVALVGPSGAGKTTLSNLVARFYDPIEGVIELDGADLTKIDVDSFRTLLGVVEQDIFLFDGTIAQNIGYGRRGATRQEIEEVAKQANSHEFISEFSDGFDTLIGERGVRLSGGQRQRIAIARAMLAQPTILILDEATSNLDTESERLIQESLHRLTSTCTSFVIAHRLSTIMHADQIVVIDHGKIIEKGTHAELMERCGVYEGMVQLQISGQNGTKPPKAPGDAEDRPNAIPAGHGHH
ncbi:MAG: ABC transporter ATP-binding protein [Planctomycetota bacterium]|nr:ABC transporter ATP-binding protein [Planctomycetota bacterium]